MARTSASLLFALLITAAGMTVQAGSAVAQGVIADLTQRDVSVTLDFTGAQVVLFGSLTGPVNLASLPDIVVEILGPSRPVHVRQKLNTGGLWINDSGEYIPQAPGYYAVVSTRPLEEIAPQETFRRLGIGFEGLKAKIARTMIAAQGENSPAYLDALVRVLSDQNLYAEIPRGVRFVGGHLFRADISLAANVPLGQYDALVYVFHDQSLTGQHQTSLLIEKAGFERLIFGLAHQEPLLYGILCVIAAIVAGLSAAYLVPRK
jgi:uncharacterized protein (TIGR02186 family)